MKEPFSLKLRYHDDELVEWAELSGAYGDLLEPQADK